MQSFFVSTHSLSLRRTNSLTSVQDCHLVPAATHMLLAHLYLLVDTPIGFRSPLHFFPISPHNPQHLHHHPIQSSSHEQAFTPHHTTPHLTIRTKLSAPTPHHRHLALLRSPTRSNLHPLTTSLSQLPSHTYIRTPLNAFQANLKLTPPL
jgi:hypothetical protein